MYKTNEKETEKFLNNISYTLSDEHVDRLRLEDIVATIAGTLSEIQPLENVRSSVGYNLGICGGFMIGLSVAAGKQAFLNGDVELAKRTIYGLLQSVAENQRIEQERKETDA